MTRKDFISLVGKSAALLLVPSCITGLSGCKKKSTSPRVVDFTLNISSGPLASNGGALVNDGVIVARTTTGAFIAVDAACTHEGTTIDYAPSTNSFHCPNHGANYDSNGNVTTGPAVSSLTSYKTSLSGSSLRVFS
ncbi:MAG TPA: Rieske (2Fe-2S) protein [Bacteroidia bacterium]|jgi:cytochrome b6-f complex iron-sulfur subunit|nr:Rieske (2Fe-2S) protein [Bacteroidia bacterium]